MVFWGVEISPKKALKQSSDAFEGGKLQVCQATLGLKKIKDNVSKSERVLVACKASNGSKIFLCSLIPGVMESCSLNLVFDEDVVFSVVGSYSVHLAGYYWPLDEIEAEEDDSDEDLMFGGYDFDEEEKESDEDTSDDDNDVPMALPTNTSVKIEEIFDEEPDRKDQKVRNTDVENGVPSLLQQEKGQKHKENSAGKQDHKSAMGVEHDEKNIEESEDEDGFPLPQKQKRPPNESTQPEEEIDIQLQDHKDDTKTVKIHNGGSDDEGGSPAPEKRKKPPSESETPLKKLKSDEKSTGILESGEKKKKKKRTKKKKKSQEDSSPADVPGNGENAKSSLSVQGITRQENTIDPTENNLSAKTPEKQLEKRKSSNVNDETPILLDPKSPGKKGSPRVRKYPNGLEVEEISMGKPDGKQAKPGKRVAMHYTGRLKSNGKIFDSSIGRKPFEFRLGVGEVIKGWDVGVNGMRIGDKRKLTIPPQMGYGAAGVPGTIPQNAWLVFDVELVNVK